MYASGFKLCLPVWQHLEMSSSEVTERYVSSVSIVYNLFYTSRSSNHNLLHKTVGNAILNLFGKYLNLSLTEFCNFHTFPEYLPKYQESGDIRMFRRRITSNHRLLLLILYLRRRNFPADSIDIAAVD